MKNKKLMMVFYIILIIILAIAFITVNIYKQLKEGGQCSTTADCKNLAHVQCTGNWTCEKNRCGFVCKTNVQAQPQNGGLSGATVECIDDSNCNPGLCPDNTTYKRYTCQANKCIDINYFADPCKYK